MLLVALLTMLSTAVHTIGVPLASGAAGPERLNATATATAPSRQPIPWTELGAKATTQYSGDGLAISAAENGAVRLRCVFQRLAGEVTGEGLWLASTAGGARAGAAANNPVQALLP